MDVQTQVPEAVRKQAEKAEEIHRKMYPDQYPQGGEQTEKETSLPEGAPKPGEQPKPGEKPKTEEAKPGEPAKVEAKPGETVLSEDAKEWKQKYDTLQGKYNAEVPALHMAVASLTNQVKELQGKIAAPAPPPEKPEEKKEEGKKEESPEDKIVTAFKEEYPDIFEAVAKMIGPKPKGEEKPKEEKSKGEKAPPAPTGNPRATFDFYLNRDVPDWKQVNTDPEFLMFLGTYDPNFPGMTKLQSIQAAYDAADATTVIGHFRDFKAGKKTAAPGPGPAPGPEKELSPEEKFLAPPKGGRSPAGPETGPTVTAQDLTKFYDEARRGLWGLIGEEKFRKEEARLLAALTKKT